MIFAFLLSRALSAWEDFYVNISTPETVITNRNERYTGASNAFYLRNCAFSNLDVAELGGAIYVSLSAEGRPCILIENTQFQHCTATEGGAIYIVNSGQNVLNQVTAAFCQSTQNQNEFAYMQSGVMLMDNDTTILNQMTATAISNCVNPNGKMCANFINGAVFFEYGNITYNSMAQMSAIHSDPSLRTIIRYSSLLHNVAGQYEIVDFDGQILSHMWTCTFINNSQPMDYTRAGLINVRMTGMFRNSEFRQNHAEFVFYLDDGGSLISLIDTTIDDTTTIRGNNNFSNVTNVDHPGDEEVHPLSIGAIAGIAVAAVVVLGVIIALSLYFFVYKKRRSDTDILVNL